MRTYTVGVEYAPSESGYTVRVPAPRGCYTQGDTVEGVHANAKEATAGHFAACEQVGAPIPEKEDRVSAAAM